MNGTAKPGWSDLRRDPLLLAACGFGAGLVPRAPGTAGTVLAALLWLALFRPLPWWLQLAFVAASLAFGLWLCSIATRKLAGVHDHQAIVWDEFAGVWLAIWLAPPGWAGFVLAVVLFRVLDIAKPWPVSLADRRVGGGLGIMLDDVLAGLIAGIMVVAGMGLAGVV